MVICHWGRAWKCGSKSIAERSGAKSSDPNPEKLFRFKQPSQILLPVSNKFQQKFLFVSPVPHVPHKTRDVISMRPRHLTHQHVLEPGFCHKKCHSKATKSPLVITFSHYFNPLAWPDPKRTKGKKELLCSIIENFKFYV